jgi:pectate lyase
MKDQKSPAFPGKRFSALRAGLCAVAMAATAPTLLAADGFGRNATGGAGGTTVTATTAAQLKQYAESATTYIINIPGTIDLVGEGINLKGNKTLHGTGTSATIKGTLNLNNLSNVIIDHLNITANTGAAGEKDGITIYNSSNIYITKCSVYDCTDGCIDTRTGSTDITISWCKFYYTRDNGHNFANLIGAADNDTPTGNITFHHNWWSTLCKQRMPADRFGQVHMYNNYFNCSGNLYCSEARLSSQILSQNNYYQGVNNPCFKSANGRLRVSGNTYSSCTGNQFTTQDSVFTPGYSYTLDATANVPGLIQAGAGNTSGGGGGPVANGTYRIIARHSGLGLDVTASGTANGTNVQQWNYSGGTNQRWIVTNLGNSEYRISPVHASDKGLDVADTSTSNGANVQIWNHVGASNQKWILTATSGGYYRVSPVHASDKALDVVDSSTSNGANVQIWNYVGSDNQQFSFQAP